MFPLDFDEFIRALDYEKVAEEIKNHYKSNEPMNIALHKLVLDLYKKYLFVGGMPAGVKRFIETESFLSAQIIQNDIFNEYTADMSKYAVYAYLPDFKLYMSDVGLLALKSRLPAELLVAENNEVNTFMESVTENHVTQAFTVNKITLFYWKNDNTAEVDFVLQKGVDVIPVEVKRSINTRSKSMNIFAKQYHCPYSIRISQKNFGFENNIKFVPLYAVFCI